MDLGYGLTKISFNKYLAGIAVITFFRILWLQFILAGIGTNMLDGIPAIFDYFEENPGVVQYSAVYFLAVFIVTIAAVVARFFKKRKKP